ncbi:MAG: MBL fold metallo-hydrolase [Chloroflexota bacterium]|nr:MBL fold metallo-hydrolase [Chloroflexota bacterium]
MTNFICVTCGIQYPATPQPPEHCRICEDDRQYVNSKGQMWTTLGELRKDRRNVLRTLEPGLTGIRTEPQFAIGQQANLIQTSGGNVLWDCISFIDDATVDAVRALGGIRAIAICHPHFYSSMIEWSRAFGNVPIYLHASNREWVMRPDSSVVYWDGETHSLGDGLTLIRCGGHFPGSTVLHWTAGADGHGALFTGDTINVVADRRYVSFLYSYPNQIPLPASAIQGIVNAVEPFQYDRIYGGWLDSVVPRDAQAGVRFSAERYIRAIRN